MKFKEGDLLKSGGGLMRLIGYSFFLLLCTSASFGIGSLFGGTTGLVIGLVGTGAFGLLICPVIKENWDDFSSGLSGFSEGIRDPFNPKRSRARSKEVSKKANETKVQNPKAKKSISLASLVSLFSLLKREKKKTDPLSNLTGENLNVHLAEVRRHLEENELRNKLR